MGVAFFHDKNDKYIPLKYSLRTVLLTVVVIAVAVSVVAERSRKGRNALRLFKDHGVTPVYCSDRNSMWGWFKDRFYDVSSIHLVCRLDFSNSGAVYLKELSEMALAIPSNELQIENCEIMGDRFDWTAMASKQLAMLDIKCKNEQLFNEDLEMYISSPMHRWLHRVSFAYLGDDYPRCGAISRHARHSVLWLSGFRLDDKDVRELTMCRFLQGVRLRDCQITAGQLADIAGCERIWYLGLEKVSGLDNDARWIDSLNKGFQSLDIDGALVNKDFLNRYEFSGNFNLTVLCRNRTQREELDAIRKSIGMKKYVELAIIDSSSN